MLGSTVIDALRRASGPARVRDRRRVRGSAPDQQRGGGVRSRRAMASALPTRVRMVVTSRWDPPWPLTRLRLDGRLVELRGQDLAFGLPDGSRDAERGVGSVAVRRAGPRLVERTDGWAAGLQLAGISLQDANDPDRDHRRRDRQRSVDRGVPPRGGGRPTGPGGAPVPAAYVDPGVVHPRAVRRCRRGCARHGPCSMSSNADRSSLSVSTAWNGSATTTCSPTCCAIACSGTTPMRWTELHRSASMWLLEHGHLMEAVTHLLAAGDHDEAYRVISIEGHQWFERGESATLVKWLGTIVDRDAAAPAAVAINLLAAQVAADESTAAAETHRHLMRRSDLTLGERLAAAALHALLVFRELPPEESLKSARFVRENLPLVGRRRGHRLPRTRGPGLGRGHGRLRRSVVPLHAR